MTFKDRWELNSQPFPFLFPSAAQYQPSTLCRHSGSKPMGFFSFSFFGLICSFHNISLINQTQNWFWCLFINQIANRNVILYKKNNQMSRYYRIDTAEVLSDFQYNQGEVVVEKFTLTESLGFPVNLFSQFLG